MLKWVMTVAATRGRPSSATAILDAALSILDDGGTVSIESVAVAAGLTKPGLMYHFRTKAALMDALVDHVVDELESELVERLAMRSNRHRPCSGIGRTYIGRSNVRTAVANW